MSKPPIDPIRWQPPPSRPLPAPDFTAELHLVAVPGTAPEDVVADADGNIWTGVEHGRIVPISPDGGSVQVIADTGGGAPGPGGGARGRLVFCGHPTGALACC